MESASALALPSTTSNDAHPFMLASNQRLDEVVVALRPSNVVMRDEVVEHHLRALLVRPRLLEVGEGGGTA